MWDLIVSVPDHCLSFYFVPFNVCVSFPFRVWGNSVASVPDHCNCIEFS